MTALAEHPQDEANNLFVLESNHNDHNAWGDPIPLDEPSGPPFPLEQLPALVAEYAAALAEQMQVPAGLPALTILASISVSAGSKWQTSVPQSGWNEPVHIQAISVLESGNRKSAVVNACTAPIYEWERRCWIFEKPRLKDWESKQRYLEKQLAAAESALGREDYEGKITDPEARRLALIREIYEHEQRKPVLTRRVLDDATVESVKSHLAEQIDGVGIISAESSFLSIVAGRYSDSSNLDALLNGHSADPIIVDRKGREPEHIDRPCLTLCLSVQPKVIADLGRVDGFVERGGAARILPSIEESLLGFRRIRVVPVTPELSTQWADLLTRILKYQPPRTVTESGKVMPANLFLTGAAYDRLEDFREQFEIRLRPGADLELIKDWGGKLPGAILRLSALMHIAMHDIPEQHEIDLATLERGIALGEYFIEHAKVMYRMMTGQSEISGAKRVLKAIRECAEVPLLETSKRDVHQKLHNGAAFRDPANLDAPLATLEELGWIQTFKQGKSLRIQLNPFALDHNDHNALEMEEF